MVEKTFIQPNISVKILAVSSFSGVTVLSGSIVPLNKLFE